MFHQEPTPCFLNNIDISMFICIKQRTTPLISLYESTTQQLSAKQNLFNPTPFNRFLRQAGDTVDIFYTKSTWRTLYELLFAIYREFRPSMIQCMKMISLNFSRFFETDVTQRSINSLFLKPLIFLSQILINQIAQFTPVWTDILFPRLRIRC